MANRTMRKLKRYAKTIDQAEKLDRYFPTNVPRLIKQLGKHETDNRQQETTDQSSRD